MASSQSKNCKSKSGQNLSVLSAKELGVRRATMLRQEQTSSATARMTLLPTRAMIGLRNQLLRQQGTVIMNSLPHGYEALGTLNSSKREMAY